MFMLITQAKQLIERGVIHNGRTRVKETKIIYIINPGKPKMEHTLILNIFIGTIMPILFKIRLIEYKVIVDNTTFFNNRLIDFISSPINYIN